MRGIHSGIPTLPHTGPTNGALSSFGGNGISSPTTKSTETTSEITPVEHRIQSELGIDARRFDDQNYSAITSQFPITTLAEISRRTRNLPDSSPPHSQPSAFQKAWFRLWGQSVEIETRADLKEVLSTAATQYLKTRLKLNITLDAILLDRLSRSLAEYKRSPQSRVGLQEIIAEDAAELGLEFHFLADDNFKIRHPSESKSANASEVEIVMKAEITKYDPNTKGFQYSQDLVGHFLRMSILCEPIEAVANEKIFLRGQTAREQLQIWNTIVTKLGFTQTAHVLSALQNEDSEPCAKRVSQLVANILSHLEDSEESIQNHPMSLLLTIILGRMPISGEEDSFFRVTLDHVLKELIENPDTRKYGLTLLQYSQIYSSQKTGVRFVRAFELMPKEEFWYTDLAKVLKYGQISPGDVPLQSITNSRIDRGLAILEKLSANDSRLNTEALQDLAQNSSQVSFEILERIVSKLLQNWESIESDPNTSKLYLKALQGTAPYLAGEFKDELKTFLNLYQEPDRMSAFWIDWYLRRGDKNAIEQLKKMVLKKDQNSTAAMAAMIRITSDIRGLPLDGIRLMGLTREKRTYKNLFSQVKIDREQLAFLLTLPKQKQVSLHSVDLSGLDLSGFDFKDADLSQTYIRNCKLNGANLKQANLVNADLTGSDLSQVDLENVDLTHLIINDQATLISLRDSGAKISDETFKRLCRIESLGRPKKPLHVVIYNDQTLTSGDRAWRNIDFIPGNPNTISEIKFYLPAEFVDNQLDQFIIEGTKFYQVLRGNQFQGTVFRNCEFFTNDFKNNDFTNARFENCTFYGVDYSDNVFTHAQFIKCHFSHRRHVRELIDYKCTFEKCDFKTCVELDLEALEKLKGKLNKINAEHVRHLVHHQKVIEGFDLRGLFLHLSQAYVKNCLFDEENSFKGLYQTVFETATPLGFNLRTDANTIREADFRKCILKLDELNFLNGRFCKISRAQLEIYLAQPKPPEKVISFDLRGLDLSGLDFSGWTFKSCDLRDCNWSKAKLVGVEFIGMSVPKEFFEQDTDLRFLNLRRATTSEDELNTISIRASKHPTISGFKISRAQVEICIENNFSLSGFDLSGLDLRGLDFSDSDLNGVNFTDTDLHKTNLRDVHNIELAKINSLRGTLVSKTQLQVLFNRGIKISRAQVEICIENNFSLSGFDLSGLDLRGLDFSGVDLKGVNFKGANLSGANLDGAKNISIDTNEIAQSPERYQNLIIAQADLDLNLLVHLAKNGGIPSRKQLEMILESIKEFDGWKMDVWDFSELNLRGKKFKNCSLRSSCFSQSWLYHISFDHCDLTSASFQSASLHDGRLYSSNFTNAAFTDARFHNCDFNNTDITNADFKNTIWRDSSFKSSISTKYQAVHWTNTDLQGLKGLNRDFILSLQYSKAKIGSLLIAYAFQNQIPLQGFDFRNSNVNVRFNLSMGVSLQNQNVSGSIFSNIDFTQFNFMNNNWTGSDFSNAKLDGANFQNVILNQTNLRGADFSKANLDGTDLRGADLTGANLSGVTVSHLTRIDEETKFENAIMPDNLREFFRQRILELERIQSLAGAIPKDLPSEQTAHFQESDIHHNKEATS